MDTRIPAALRSLLEDYIQSLAHGLPHLLEGLYLVGSIAVGAFNEKLGDIDFVAIIHHQPGRQEIERLRELHRTIRVKYPHWKLEGSYLRSIDLGRAEAEIPPHPCCQDNRFHPAAYHDENPVTWWLLKNRGIALLGPRPADLAFGADWDSTIKWMHGNLNSYWAKWIDRPSNWVFVLSDNGFQWAVLGVLRQFYSFRENDIVSKTMAGRYALSCLPRGWHPLIEEAIDIRERGISAPRQYNLARAVRTRNFLKYMVATCNAMWN